MAGLQEKFIAWVLRAGIKIKRRSHDITIGKINKYIEKEKESKEYTLYVEYLCKKSEFEVYEMDVLEKLYQRFYNMVIW